jgi:uncharacterized coiled-coil protein SlyX
MDNYKEKLNLIKSKIEENKIEKAKLEERTHNLEEEKQEIMVALAEKELTIDKLSDKVAELKKEIEEQLEKCSDLLE